MLQHLFQNYDPFFKKELKRTKLRTVFSDELEKAYATGDTLGN